MGVVGPSCVCGGAKLWVWWGQVVGVVGPSCGCGGAKLWVWWGQVVGVVGPSCGCGGAKLWVWHADPPLSQGRTSVMKDVRAKCDECKRDINVSCGTSSPHWWSALSPLRSPSSHPCVCLQKEMHEPLLKVMVLRAAVVSHQECALYLLQYMESLALKSGEEGQVHVDVHVDG